MKSTLREIIEWLMCIIIAVVLALVVRYYIGTPTIVQQTSMFPTLNEDERLWLNRWGRTTKKMPQRGDIVTFEAPSVIKVTVVDYDNPVAIYDYEPQGLLEKFSYYVLESSNKKSYIKRVIGLPGEYIEIKNGFVYINGEKLEENYYFVGGYNKRFFTLEDAKKFFSIIGKVKANEENMSRYNKPKMVIEVEVEKQ